MWLPDALIPSDTRPTLLKCSPLAGGNCLTGHRLEHGDTAGGDDPDELFDLVDERDQVIGRARRGEVHGNPALVHRSVQVLVVDRHDRVLLQRRSRAKDLYPGYFCASASGHVAAGEDYARTAEREVGEELGVALPLTCIGKVLVRSALETEMTAVYVACSDGPFYFHPTETAGGTFFTRAELARARADGHLPLTPALQSALDVLDSAVPPDHSGS
jgi:16S rRNA (adenine1518-N6/adenine1519-N6)-dimethyltransferase